MHIESHGQMCAYAHSHFVTHVCTFPYSSILHMYQTHIPHSSREKLSTPWMSTKGILFAFFSNGIQGSEWPSTVLCMAVHKDSTGRPWVKTCKACKHPAHVYAPVTLATGQSLTHSTLPSLEVEGLAMPICTHCPAPACHRLVPSSKGPWMPSAVPHVTSPAPLPEAPAAAVLPTLPRLCLEPASHPKKPSVMRCNQTGARNSPAVM